MKKTQQTIAAISTSTVASGVGIVRISGPKAFSVAAKIFFPSKKEKFAKLKTHTINHGWIIDKLNNKYQRIDEVMVIKMDAPNTYTKEDTVEIDCHGGIVVLRKVLELALKYGCRMAEPGEFTKRAFLNGRIDLAQAEAVIDIIKAKTDKALGISTQQLKGELSKEIRAIRNIFLEVITFFEANIDFPDEEIGRLNLSEIERLLTKAYLKVKNLIDSSVRGKVLREGIHVVICGRPNVGKSSLLNALLKQERCIVTHIPGTTRDTVEEIIDIKGVPVRIVDTAGILEPKDLVEKKAIQRSREQIDLADLVILMFDANKKLSCGDKLLIHRLKNKNCLAVVNKIDLKRNINIDFIKSEFKHVIEISAKQVKNINLLEKEIVKFAYGENRNNEENVLISNKRHIEKINNSFVLLEDAISYVKSAGNPELVAQNLKEALGCLDDIIGERFSEEILDRIFSEFCIGK